MVARGLATSVGITFWTEIYRNTHVLADLTLASALRSVEATTRTVVGSRRRDVHHRGGGSTGAPLSAQTQAGRTNGPWPRCAASYAAGYALGPGVPDTGVLAAAPGADPPGGALAAADPGRHRVPGRGSVPVGGPPGVGDPAAQHAGAAVPFVLLRRAGDLPAAGRAGRQRGRAGRGPGAVAGVHAGRDHAALLHRGTAGRAVGGGLRRGAVRGGRAHTAPGLVRDLRRHGPVPAGPGL